VAKKKNSMALFEVISKSRDKNPDSEVLVPDWVKGQKAPEAQPAPPEAAPVEETAPVEEAAPPETTEVEPVETPSPVEPPSEVMETPLIDAMTPEPEPQPEPALQAPETLDTPEPTAAYQEPPPASSVYSAQAQAQTDDLDKTTQTPIWNTDGARLTISLNYISCLVASIGILLLIIGAFALGRATAPSATIAGPTGPTTIKREVGKYYMVIQRFTGRGPEVQAEAERIVKFCAANGEPSQVQLTPRYVNGKVVKGQYNTIVWSATPFDSRQSEEVSGHGLFIQNELGAKYAKKYGSRFRFIQPQRNGKIAPTMYPYKKR
jgi:hypothetical protein